MDARARTGQCSSRARASARRSASRAEAMLTRTRWPGWKRQAVASTSIASSTISPGVSGSGSVSECRRVALSMPFATRCDEPSGATSDRLTAKPTTEAVDADVEDGPRPPDDRQRFFEWLGRVNQRQRLVGTLVARQPERDPAGPQAGRHADRRLVLEGRGTV